MPANTELASIRRARATMSTQHFVLCAFKSGAAWIERDGNETDLETTIRDIIALQIEDPLKIIAVDPGEGWARDVTEDVAIAIANRHAGQVCHPKLIEFVEAHAGTLLANELQEDAA